jgi:holo-[acyl-carrier protein] synthase
MTGRTGRRTPAIEVITAPSADARRAAPADVGGLTAATARDGAERLIAIGIDLEDVERVDAMVRRYGDRFLGRVFTEREAAYCRRRRFPAQHLAGRFSAKEAAMKALGTGHSRGVLWRDVEVVRRHGPPRLEFHGGARRQFDRLGARRALVSITHTSRLAMAQVVLLA